MSAIRPNAIYTYFGIKRRTKEQLQLLMYSKEIEEWKSEFAAEEERTEAHRQEALIQEQQRLEDEDAAIRVHRRWSIRRRSSSSKSRSRRNSSSVAGDEVLQ